MQIVKRLLIVLTAPIWIPGSVLLIGCYYTCILIAWPFVYIITGKSIEEWAP